VDSFQETRLSWNDLGVGEAEYHVYRGEAKDFATTPPQYVGDSGGPDGTTFVDTSSPAAPPIRYYRVRAAAACDVEETGW
jgi:hypothetical protein